MPRTPKKTKSGRAAKGAETPAATSTQRPSNPKALPKRAPKAESPPPSARTSAPTARTPAPPEREKSKIEIPDDGTPVRNEKRRSYRAFLLFLLGGRNVRIADIEKAMTDKIETMNHVSLMRWKRDFAWEDRKEAMVRAGLDPEGMAYDAYKREFLLQHKGADLARLFRVIVKRTGMPQGISPAQLDDDYDLRIQRTAFEAGVPLSDAAAAAEDARRRHVNREEETDSEDVGEEEDEESEDPRPITPSEQDAPPLPVPRRPMKVPKVRRPDSMTSGQAQEFLRRFGGNPEEGATEAARVRVRELAPNLPPALQTEVSILIARLDGLEKGLQAQRTRSANSGDRDVKLIDMTLGSYVAALTAQVCKHCGQDCGHRAITPKPSDLPGLLRVKRMLQEIPGVQSPGSPAEAAQESVRVQDARKTGNPRAVLQAMRDEAEEMVLVFDAALRAGPVDSGRYLDEDSEDEE